MNSSEKKFGKAFVIFIDILGSQSRSDFDELLKINGLFHSELLDNRKQDREYVSYQRHIYTFSDCAYIIYDYRNKSTANLGALFQVALLNCEPLFMKFLSEGLVFRGGAAYGDVYYDENTNMFFGDAINRAYQYESKVAIYPRIVLDDYIAENLIEYSKRTSRRSKKQRLTFAEHIGCLAGLDSDGKYYFNYFNSIQQGRDYSQIINKSNTQFLDDVISMCEAQIEIFRNNEHVRHKYEWLRKYAEQSRNAHIGKAVVYKKPFWDKVFNQMPPEHRALLTMHMTVANVGISYSDKEQLEIFERFNNSEVLEALQQVGEPDETEK